MLSVNLLQYRLASEIAFQEAADETERDEAADSIADLQDHLMETGIWDSVVPSERALFTSFPGSWTEAQFGYAAWRRESLGVLLWALNLVPAIPPYDQQFQDLGAVIDPDQWLFAIEESFLVPEDDIILAQRVAETWYWRSQSGKPPFDEENNPERIAFLAAQYAAGGHIPPTLEGDFPAFGLPFHMLDDERVAYVQALASERYFCLSWLMGLQAWE